LTQIDDVILVKEHR